MGTLFLDSVFLNPYNSKFACAYVTYGDTDHPKDHQGKIIGNFYQNADGFSHHLSTVVQPLIQTRLSRFGYNIKEIDFLNQVPHPFFAIVRKDGKDMDENDTKLLTDKLQNIIDKINQKNKPSLFSKPSSSVVSTNKQSEKKRPAM